MYICWMSLFKKVKWSFKKKKKQTNGIGKNKVSTFVLLWIGLQEYSLYLSKAENRLIMLKKRKLGWKLIVYKCCLANKWKLKKYNNKVSLDWNNRWLGIIYLSFDSVVLDFDFSGACVLLQN